MTDDEQIIFMVEGLASACTKLGQKAQCNNDLNVPYNAILTFAAKMLALLESYAIMSGDNVHSLEESRKVTVAHFEELLTAASKNLQEQGKLVKNAYSKAHGLTTGEQ